MRHKPRVGCLGVGWIGRARMQALHESGLVDVCAFADAHADARAEARKIVPHAAACEGLSELLDLSLDGLVIATPSAQHAREALTALDRGCAVFCQKPLGRSAVETRRVLEAAAELGRPFGADFCYRQTRAMQSLKQVLARGELGRAYAARLVFHNAYGPDKPWYYDRALSGGGCAMDLGIHLIDALLWLFDFPALKDLRCSLYARGERLALPAHENEDFALIQLELETGLSAELACSWNLPAGCDAVIRAEIYGTQAGVCFENVNGSFYDFRADLLHKTSRSSLVSPPDAWGGRTVVEWGRALAEGAGFDPLAMRYLDSAIILDRIYGTYGPA